MVCKPENCNFQEAFPYKFKNKYTIFLFQKEKKKKKIQSKKGDRENIQKQNQSKR